jgi:hypothetical protein
MYGQTWVPRSSIMFAVGMRAGIAVTLTALVNRDSARFTRSSVRAVVGFAGFASILAGSKIHTIVVGRRNVRTPILVLSGCGTEEGHGSSEDDDIN